jgi:hypothetical protein
MNDRELEILNEIKLKNEKDKQAMQSLKDKVHLCMYTYMSGYVE